MNLSTLLCVPTLLVLSLEARAAELSQYDHHIKSYIDFGNECSALLEKVKSKESADSSAPELQKLSLRFAEIRKQFNALDVIPDASRDELFTRYEMPLRQSWGKVYSEIFRIQKEQSYGSNDFVKAFQVFCQLLNE